MSSARTEWGRRLYRATGDPQLESSLSDPSVRLLGWSTVGRNVWLLGFTSLVTDISSEMITSVLPVYLMFRLQMSPATIGLIEGLHQGGASLARVVSGLATDRLRRYKEIAVAGYLTSALCKISLLLVGASPAGLAAVTLADRVGKGVRTSPRDALISFSAPRSGLAAAFGVHRALDTVGAILGPLVAFAILRWTLEAYDVVFVVSFAVALIGVAILVTFVSNPQPAPGARANHALSLQDIRRLFADRPFFQIALFALVLGLVTLSDSLLYLVLQRRTDVALVYLPLLYVATPAAYAVMAAPVGRLADRIGRGTVIVAGYAALLAIYGTLLAPSLGTLALVSCIVLLGAHYAATDGVLAALVSGVLPATHRATGLSLVGTCHDVGKLLASAGFGWLWSRGALESAVEAYAVALLCALLAVAPRLRRFGREEA